MTSATSQLTRVEEQILDTLSSLQRPVVDAVRSFAEKAESRVPEVPGKENIPPIDALIVSQLAFAEKVLANQRHFVNELLKAIKPLTSKATSTSKPRSRGRGTTSKAAA